MTACTRFVLVPLAACLIVSVADLSESIAQDRSPINGRPEPGVRMTNVRLGELLRLEFGKEKVEGRQGAWRIEMGPEPADSTSDDSRDRPAKSDPQPEDRSSEESSSEDQKSPGVGNRLPGVILVLTDERADRMRIMMPIRAFDPNRVEDLRLALIALHANYDRALDARYAIQDRVLWSVFIHPLGSLTAADLENALNQVQTLRTNTGTTYSSSDLLFGPARAPAIADDEV